MSRLLELVREFQSAPDIEIQLRAAEELAKEIGPRLAGFLLRSQPAEQAEDLLQEALKAIFESLMDFAGSSEGEFLSWCYHIARNKGADLGRKPWVTRRECLTAEELTRLLDEVAVGEPLAAGERLDLEYALSLVKEAKPPCYDHLWNYYMLGLDYKAMAQLNHISYDAAKVTVRRCLELARRLVAEGD